MNDINSFLQFAESLKLVRKAEIEKDDKNIINDVYTDLLPNNGIISKVNLPRTSILMGRKGTGKSTIIQKSMQDMFGNNKTITLYIDVKTLYDGATPTLMVQGKNDISNMESEIVKYLIYKNFLKEIITKTKNSFKDLLSTKGKLKKVSDFLQGKEDEVNLTLDKIQISLDDVFKNIDSSLYTSIKTSVETSTENSTGINFNISATPSLSVDGSDKNFETFRKEFDSTILKYLDIKNCLIDNFLLIRSITGIKYIYIYLDDYSEIDEKAQELFMDWFVAPLNNLSDDFIKFKIATYPNRFYTGKLDNQKYDEINLDFYSALYTYKNITRMEQIAVDYIKRLIQNRFKIYLPSKQIKEYFDLQDEELYELLFDVSINTPRKIGYILSFCYETHLTYGKKITGAAISAAALRYFEEVTQRYFESNRYVLRSFEDMVSIENQKELMRKITNRQVENKINITRSGARKFQMTNPPTSHFFVSNSLSSLLDTLELNGYISTYNKLNDKTNIPSTLFSLDYGLCQKYNLSFGRPKDTNLRKYYNDHRFILNSIIKEHFNNSQIILCDNGHEFPFDLLTELEKYSMACPECLKQRIISTCKVEMSNKDILQKIQEYESNSIRLNDDIEYLILAFLHRYKSESFSSFEIAQDLDCNWQLVNKRADKLIDKDLIRTDISKENKFRRYFFINDVAIKALDREKGSDF